MDDSFGKLTYINKSYMSRHIFSLNCILVTVFYQDIKPYINGTLIITATPRPKTPDAMHK